MKSSSEMPVFLLYWWDYSPQRFWTDRFYKEQQIITVMFNAGILRHICFLPHLAWVTVMLIFKASSNLFYPPVSPVKECQSGFLSPLGNKYPHANNASASHECLVYATAVSSSRTSPAKQMFGMLFTVTSTNWTQPVFPDEARPHKL